MTKAERSDNKKDENEVDVRILLLGESGVGKTSLIVSLLEDEFFENVPSRIDNVMIPADVTPERVLTSIHDYCAKEQSKEELLKEIRCANVICVVYSVLDQSSVDMITSYWLPLIKQSTADSSRMQPVILVGNKSDQAGSSKQMEKILPIMNEFDEIETCVECSAKTIKNISEIFYYAQKAVLYPTHQLYVSEDRELTRKCKKALVRIFKLCDFDNDGLLNDYELNQFQMFVFGVPLNSIAISDVKTAVETHKNDDIIDNALALSGFIYLHQLFIHRGRHETTWKVLRRFGYDNELQLSIDYLNPPLKVPRGCSTELSYEGLQFITALFERYDEDKDGCLSPSEVQNLFSVCSTNPFSKEASASTETNNRGWITFNGYICYWILTTFMNVSLTMELLAYLGFNMRHQSQIDAIKVTRDRRIDLFEKSTTRNVFQCHVIGPKNAGKTAFIQSFLGRNLVDIASMNKKHLNPYVINSVTVKDEVKYLLLHEVDVYSRDELLTSYEKSADVIVLLYDASNPNSFAYCATIYLKYFYRTKVPCLIIATKVERCEAEQNYEQQPNEFCRTHTLPQPVRFRDEDLGNARSQIFTQLATMAVYPHLKRVYYLHDSNLLSKITFGAAVAALAGFLLYKNI
ncbi:unnamed protein product [Anisakis simplex]|uniref:Mitochondrial Rho GTPase n=1 Tax=Anisakis simplex TaxID=6269 RepID=A0A158PN50_ANISI|nr:unnamed protein product [Anisakis simplex]